ncbi:MAG: NAD(P)H-dependent oxidoreductase [Prevotellaceae bacterium]|jgi:flavodoxin|nr:NAD(P)H-dependent oxidoreductase [Prevotellaceae bacterium]
MKKFLFLTIAVFYMGTTMNIQAQNKAGKGKTLVVYYSWSGNTRTLAQQIHKLVGGDIFEVVPVKAYPEDYNKCVTQAKQEIQSGYLPELRDAVKNIEQYDTVFVGSPNWWSTISPPIAAFLSQHDLSGKTVIPFCTHGSGGRAQCFADIAKRTPKSKQCEGIAVYGSSVNSSQAQVEKWLQKLK